MTPDTSHGGESRGEVHPVERLIASGAGAAGVSAGTAAGFIYGGPEGAIAGGAAGAFLQDGFKGVVGEIADRVVTQKERERVGECLVLATDRISEKLNAGEPLRNASFFRPRERRRGKRLRAEAEELLEGTFLAARDSYEEKKVELLSRFYANAVFDKELDTAHLNHILTLAKALTYRQLALIGMVGRSMQDPLLRGSLRQTDYRGSSVLNPELIGVLYELFQMNNLNLLFSISGGYTLGLSDINPSDTQLMGNGMHLYELLELQDLPNEDTSFFKRVLGT